MNTLVGPTVDTKPIYFAIFTNNVWSYLLYMVPRNIISAVTFLILLGPQSRFEGKLLVIRPIRSQHETAVLHAGVGKVGAV